jgi:hypothetical protein
MRGEYYSRQEIAEYLKSLCIFDTQELFSTRVSAALFFVSKIIAKTIVSHRLFDFRP